MNKIRKQINKQVCNWGRVGDQIEEQIGRRMMEQIRDQIGDRMEFLMWWRIRKQIKGRAWELSDG